MKTLKLLFLLAMLPLALLVGCGAQSSPEATIKAMGNAAKAKDAQAMVELLDPEVVSQPGVKQKLTGLAEMAFEQSDERDGIKSVETTKVDEDGDKATATVKTVYGDGSTDTETLTLVKRDGKWYLTP